MSKVATLTLSPSIDASSTIERLEPQLKMRCSAPTIEPGGGGVNVARAVVQLGGHAVAVAALGGPMGALLASSLRRSGVEVERVNVRGATRQDFAVTDLSDGSQYRFIHPAPPMTAGEWRRCLRIAARAARGADWFVASGSVPEGVPLDAFAVLAQTMRDLHVPVLVDSSGPALRAAIDAPIDVVKPSINELRGVCGGELRSLDEFEAAARRLVDDGCCGAIVVSLGDAGALAVPRRGSSFVVRGPAVRAVSTSGAGDSMVAGIGLSLAAGGRFVDAVRFGVAAGTAAVLVPGTGLCHRADVERTLSQTVVVPMSELSTTERGDTLPSGVGDDPRRPPEPAVGG